MDLRTGKGLGGSGSISVITSDQNDFSSGEISIKGSRVLVQSKANTHGPGGNTIISTGTSTGGSSTGVLAKAGDGGVFGGTILVTAGESSQYIGGSL